MPESKADAQEPLAPANGSWIEFSEPLRKIHEAALSIMERTGFRFDLPEAVRLFKAAGCPIKDNGAVTIPAKLVERALASAPRTIAVYDRCGHLAMDLGQDRNYYGPGSDCANLYDLSTGLRRQAKFSDLEQALSIADGLKEIDFVMSMLIPDDLPLGCHEYFQMEAMLAATKKPMVFVGETELSTLCAIEMMVLIRGDADKLKEKPLGINYINSTSPFIHNTESVKRLLLGAKMGLPTVYQPGQGAGSAGPVTPAGNIALGHASQMAALTLHQLAQEGAPMIRALPGEGMMDLKTMVSIYLSPDMGRLGWQMAKAHGLPLFGTAGMSDSKCFDAQAAAEAAMSLTYNSLYGANLIHDLGYLDSAMTFSHELLILCDELITWLKRHLAPPEINQETLALDLIDQLGHQGGFFLNQRHTLKHLAQCCWSPKLFSHQSY
ncbi:MAG: trimethylamine methyltransferase family protein, partial [Deltaproteobacteria bacterium]|nr:trimethylamine methyltransferase family protein [Deltaproteobacteria bacterium]